MNPWVDRFSEISDKAKLVSMATVRPRPAKGLDSMSPQMAAESLEQKLKEIFLLNSSSAEILHGLVQRSLSHCINRYRDENSYLKGLYNLDYQETTPVCLTGLSGVGKSKIVDALRRISPPDSMIDPGNGHGMMPLQYLWGVNVRDLNGINQILKELASRSIGDGSGRINKSDLLSLCRRVAYRDGVSIITADEFQFYTHGNANAKVTEALLHLSTLGVPMVYVANYSLCHSLHKRPQQDRQRLLSDPIIMFPDEPGSQDWIAYIDECQRVSGGIVRGDLKKIGERIYSQTAGIKRLVVKLLKISYLCARGSGRSEITLNDLDLAYDSSEYASNKSDVESIFNYEITGRSAVLDLKCPFGKARGNGQKIYQFARDIRDEKVAIEMLTSSLTVEEKEAYSQVGGGKPKGKVMNDTPKPKRKGSASSSDLVDNFSNHVGKLKGS